MFDWQGLAVAFQSHGLELGLEPGPGPGPVPGPEHSHLLELEHWRSLALELPAAEPGPVACCDDFA